MHLVADILDSRILPHNEGLRKIRFYTFAFGVYPHQVQLLPGAFNNVADTEIKLAGHDDGMVFVSELVEEFHADTVDLVVYIKAKEISIGILGSFSGITI